MFEASAKAHVILALNQTFQDEDLTILGQHGFYPIATFKGMYNGIIENSYLVPLWNQEQYQRLFDLAKEYHQESIIHLIRVSLSKPIVAYVIKLEDKSVLLPGVWQHVGINQPNKNAWTLDNDTKEYYIIN
jgi:hypothetical protein